MNYDHAVMGMITMIIGLIQPINAIFRPHAPKENEGKTTLRLVWEICHKGLGWIGILFAFITIWMGTTLLKTKEDRRMFQFYYGVWVLGFLVLIASFMLLEKKQDKYNQVPAKEETDPEVVEVEEVEEVDKVDKVGEVVEVVEDIATHYIYFNLEKKQDKCNQVPAKEENDPEVVEAAEVAEVVEAAEVVEVVEVVQDKATHYIYCKLLHGT